MAQIKSERAKEPQLPRGLWWNEKDKSIALSRCPACNRENYAFNVLSGVCTWCGYNANNDEHLLQIMKGYDNQ